MILAEKVLAIQELLVRHPRPIGFVPTMGALHSGHTSLVARAATENSTVVSSVFVNPTQFTDPNDLVNYPRTPDKDLEMLTLGGSDLVFMPDVDEVYPGTPTPDFDFGTLETVMEGVFRPGHFKGVAMVVSRFFDIIKPDNAYFGEKDYQQLAVIREMNRQQHNRVNIIGCPTIREQDGLAMSSRNIRLTPEERAKAGAIYSALLEAKENIANVSVKETRLRVALRMEQTAVFKLQYFEIVHAETLHAADKVVKGNKYRACIAVLAAHTRLIDNVAI